MSDLIYLLYLLPGFLIYAISYRLLNYTGKKDSFETTFLSIFLSILVYIGLNYFQSLGYISLANIDWILGMFLTLLIASLSALSIIVVKYGLPKLEKFTQIFDTVKQTPNDIITDVLEEIQKKELAIKYGIHLAICTEDDKVFAGYIHARSNPSDEKKWIYLKKVTQIDGKRGRYNTKEFDGMLFPEDQIKWISTIKYNIKPTVR